MELVDYMCRDSVDKLCILFAEQTGQVQILVTVANTVLTNWTSPSTEEERNKFACLATFQFSTFTMSSHHLEFCCSYKHSEMNRTMSQSMVKIKPFLRFFVLHMTGSLATYQCVHGELLLGESCKLKTQLITVTMSTVLMGVERFCMNPAAVCLFFFSFGVAFANWVTFSM